MAGDWLLIDGPSLMFRAYYGVARGAAAGMIRRYGDIAEILREKPLRDADREYLANAIRVVTPVAHLPVSLSSCSWRLLRPRPTRRGDLRLRRVMMVVLVGLGGCDARYSQRDRGGGDANDSLHDGSSILT